MLRLRYVAHEGWSLNDMPDLSGHSKGSHLVIITQSLNLLIKYPLDSNERFAEN